MASIEKRGKNSYSIVVFLGEDAKGTKLRKRMSYTQMDLNTPYHKFQEIITAFNATAKKNDRLPLLRIHDLRHTSASIMVAQGYDLPTIARRLGHSQITTTLNRYTHPVTDDSAISSGLSAIFFAAPKEETAKLSAEEWQIIQEYRRKNGELMGNYVA